MKIQWRTLPEDCKTYICIGAAVFAFVCFVCLLCWERLTPVFFAQQLTSTAFYLFIIIAVDFIISLIKNKKPYTGAPFYIAWLITFIIATPYIPIVFGYGNTQIGHFYEKKEYTETYMVIMSHKPESVDNRKVYTLPASISKFEDYITTNTHIDQLSGEYEERDITGDLYHINNLYFKNGGYLTFEEENIVFPDKEVELKDYHGKTYYITLTRNIYEKEEK